MDSHQWSRAVNITHEQCDGSFLSSLVRSPEVTLKAQNSESAPTCRKVGLSNFVDRFGSTHNAIIAAPVFRFTVTCGTARHGNDDNEPQAELIATMNLMAKQPRYTPEHAKAGLDAQFPEIETWPNQFPGYEIEIDDPEFTSVCPKTGLPDFGHIVIRYMPDKRCLELKSLKEYLFTYRNLGIFQENVVNRVLEDVVRWAKPVWAEVQGEWRPRGGISGTIVARWPRPKGTRR